MNKILMYASAAVALLVGCLAVGQAGCTCTVHTLSYADADAMVCTPATMYRGTDYLGSDTAYHYFEYKRELTRDVRFRVSRADLTIDSPFVYSPHNPQRRAAEEYFGNNK